MLPCRKPRTSGIAPPRRPTWPGLPPSTRALPRSTSSWRSDFPDYAALVSPEPLSVEDVQAQLGADEALVLFLDTPEWKPTPEETFIWVVTKTDMRWVRIGARHQGADRARRRAALRARRTRCGMRLAVKAQDVQGRVGSGARRGDGEGRGQGQRRPGLPFDLARAHELYKALLGPVEDLIKGKHLLIVPSGPLTSLPFNVLVTEPPKAATPEQARRLPDRRLARDAAADHRAALRRLAEGAARSSPRRATRPSLSRHRQPAARWTAGRSAVGRHSKSRRSCARDKQQCPKTLTQRIAARRGAPGLTASPSYSRGANADIEEVRQWTPLPETADELCEVGRRLGVAESDILLGARATETALKDLSERASSPTTPSCTSPPMVRCAGQVQGSAEPGLILTPPPKARATRSARTRRWLPHRLRDRHPQARCRLGDPVGLQHGRQQWRDCGGAVRHGARVLLCRRPRAAGVALGGRLRRDRQADHQRGRRNHARQDLAAPRRCAAPC